MPIPTTIAELSTTAASNYPSGSDSPSVLDDVQRAHASFIAQLRDREAGLRNRIINGNFSINQRGVSGTVTLAAGAYGHDRWKAGTSGCTYTFATTANITTVTITAGSLIQVIEGLNLESGEFALSWTGNATGKIGAGSYSASGVTGAITGGTNTNIEFSTGTLSKVQLELGSTATTFEQRPYGLELALCHRYYQLIQSSCTGLAKSSTVGEITVQLLCQMRAAPSFLNLGNGTWIDGAGAAAITGAALTTASAQGQQRVEVSTTGGMVISRPIIVVTQTMGFSAEL